MEALTIQAEAPAEAVVVRFKVSGLPQFELELEPTTAVRDVKKLAKEMCSIEPEHMKLFYRDRELKDAETLECYNADDAETPVRIMYTAGHTAMLGGSNPPGRAQRDPYLMPVRGIPGSKGARCSRVSGRRGATASSGS